MAILSDADRLEIWAEFMQEISGDGDPIAVTKADLRAAFNALDDWLDDNAASANIAIPQPARNALTSAQKARILMHVIRRRFLAGS